MYSSLSPSDHPQSCGEGVWGDRSCLTLVSPGAGGHLLALDLQGSLCRGTDLSVQGAWLRLPKSA